MTEGVLRAISVQNLPSDGSGIELAVVLPAMLAPVRLLPVQIRVKARGGVRVPASHV